MIIVVQKRKLFYKCFIVLSVLSVVMVACEEEKPMPSPQIHLNMPDGGYELDYDSVLVLDPKITYDYESTYQWLLDGQVVSTEKTLHLEPDTLQSYQYTFVVQNPSGSDTLVVPVNAMRILYFEEFGLKKDTFYCNPQVGNLTSKGVTFPFQYVAGDEASTWNGFALSSMTNTSVRTLKNPFSANVGYGSDKSLSYLVCHQQDVETGVTVSFDDNRVYRIRSVDVVNTAYMVGAIKNGTDLLSPFGEGKQDAFVLGVRGFRADGSVSGELLFYLADYTREVKTERYALEKWATIDLRELGRVQKIEMKLFSTEGSLNPKNTLSYFCLDNLKLMD